VLFRRAAQRPVREADQGRGSGEPGGSPGDRSPAKSVLFHPQAFEPLTDEGWDERRVRAAIADIVADADAALRGPRLLWPAHEWDRWRSTSPMKNLYVGAAGVLWALDELRRRDHAETQLDLAALALRTLERFRAAPDFMKGVELPAPPESALLAGETGILLVAFRLAPSAGLAHDLYGRVRANVRNEAEDVMWGTPGTLVAAHTMLGWTGEERRVAGERGGALVAARRGGVLAPTSGGSRVPWAWPAARTRRERASASPAAR
jgi:hypothetical protein